MMEVPTDEEAQEVLLEGIEGTQYITIQRADSENLGKSVNLFTLNGEIIPEGMVVDMINGVGADYNTGTQYYETEDLLSQVQLTEDDKRLAAALVTFQFQQQQQQKQQQISNHQNPDDTLEDVAHLESLQPVNTYSIENTQASQSPSDYQPLPSYKREFVKHEFVNVKCEADVDIPAENSEDITPNSGPKRSLPHKKRIPHKLKQESKKSVSKKDSSRSNRDGLSSDTNNKMHINAFKCELCRNNFSGQLKFFEHLKSHYEPPKEEKKLQNKLINNNLTLPLTNVPKPTFQVLESTIEEFSEPEDIMEGIRGVVEETGAQLEADEDEDDENPLSESHNSSLNWEISEVSEQVENEEEPSTINEEDLIDQSTTVVSSPVKKKKSKSKNLSSDLNCPNCDRVFHHKNSLVYHMRSHSGERPHQCEVCGKSFFAASALKVHKRLHSGDKPYKCEECGRHFRQWGDLKYHSTSLHSEQRQFQCEYCGKDFARKYSLIVHRRIHTGEKNYRCEYCNKTFRASSYLQNHRRIHTGEKPHPCDVCGKPFRVRSDMKRHMLTHSRSPPGPEKVNVKNTTKTEENEPSNSSDDDGLKANTIDEMVHDYKLEVDPTAAVVQLIQPTDNMLPHVNVQTLTYETVEVAQSNGSVQSANDRDPLEAVVAPTSDTLTFDEIQLYSIIN